MADPKEPTATETPDKEVQDVKPTLTDETQDTDVSIEDIEIPMEDLEDEDDETEEPEVEEPVKEVTTEEEPEDDGGEEQSEPEEESEEEPQPGESDDTASDVAQKAFQEREERRKAKEAEQLKQKEEDQHEYLQDAEDDKDLALRQLQVNAYNQTIKTNKTDLQSGLNRAIADIDLIRNGTPEQQEAIVKRVDLFEKLYVTYDSNQDPIRVDGDLYQFLKEEADIIDNLSKVGARKEKKAKADTKARTFNSPSKKPPEPKVDEDLADFDTEMNRYR